MVGILRRFFADPYFSVYQEESAGEKSQGESKPDMSVLKVLSRPGGSPYHYDYCMVESKKLGRNWDEAIDHLTRHCAGNGNESGQVYAIVQIGLEIQFYKWNGGRLNTLGGRLHLRREVTIVTPWFGHLVKNPSPLV
jgi:hypothetical protein